MAVISSLSAKFLLLQNPEAHLRPNVASKTTVKTPIDTEFLSGMQLL